MLVESEHDMFILFFISTGILSVKGWELLIVNDLFSFCSFNSANISNFGIANGGVSSNILFQLLT